MISQCPLTREPHSSAAAIWCRHPGPCWCPYPGLTAPHCSWSPPLTSPWSRSSSSSSSSSSASSSSGPSSSGTHPRGAEAGYCYTAHMLGLKYEHSSRHRNYCIANLSECKTFVTSDHTLSLNIVINVISHAQGSSQPAQPSPAQAASRVM